VYMIGTDRAQRELARDLVNHPDARLVGMATLSPGPLSGDAHRLLEQVAAAGATVLVLDDASMKIPELAGASAWLRSRGLRVWDLVSYYEQKLGKLPLSELSPAWFASGRGPGRRGRIAGVVWRAVEAGISAVLLLLVAVPLVLAAVLVRLTTPGPALYRQRRVGKDGRPFTLLKLRTMYESTDEEPGWASSHGYRVTRIGRHLRRFRLDELPQLWNVIRGDLALIGPRPEQVPIAERLGRELPNYYLRHCVRPGITGWAQVHIGYAGSVEGTTAKLQRDLYYVRRRTLRLDLLIAWLTVKLVLDGRE